MALTADVQSVDIVADHGAVAGVYLLLGDGAQAGTQVGGSGTLTHQNMQAGTQLGQCLFLVGAFMVAGDTGADISVQLSAHQSGSVTLGADVVILSQLQHMSGSGAASQNGGIQNLCQADSLGQLHQIVQHRGVQGAAGGLDTILLHEGRDGIIQLNGGVLGLGQNFLHAVDAGNDGDFHQVGGNSGGTVLDNHLGKLGIGEHAALDVDVCIQETGSQVHALGIDNLGVGTDGTGGDIADGSDLALGNGDLSLVDLVREDVDQLAVLDDDVSRLLAQCYLNQFVIHVSVSFSYM